MPDLPGFHVPRKQIQTEGQSQVPPLLKIQHTKYSKSVKLAVPCQEKYPDCPARLHRTVPVRSAQLTLFTPLRHFFFIRYLYIIHFFQNGVTTVLDVDCHSMSYLFYACTRYFQFWTYCTQLFSVTVQQLTRQTVMKSFTVPTSVCLTSRELSM